MTEGYVPTCFADEVTPPPRPGPDDWTVAKDGRFFFDKSGDFFDADDEMDNDELANGDAIPFMRLETFPNATLTVDDDGSWTVDPPAPDGAQQVVIEYEPETLDVSVKDLVANCALDAGEYDLRFFTWHNEVWTFDAAAGKFSRGAA
jgi:hypothetical protein